jgi:hypothetical protein
LCSALDLAHATARRGLRRRLDHRASPHLAAGVAGQPGARTPRGGRCAPLPHLGIGTGARAAQDQQGVGPGVPQPLAPPRQSREPWRAGAAFGLEHRRAQAPREALGQRKRQAASAPSIALRAGLCLVTRDGGLGGLASAHEEPWRAVIGRPTWSQPPHRQTRAGRATWLAKRASVGGEASGAPGAGRRSRRSGKRGAARQGLAALASAEPAALCPPRGVRRSGRGQVTRCASRWSDSTAARACVKPCGSSMSWRRTTPASEDKRPPSPARATALAPTGARGSGGRGRGGARSACIDSNPGIVSSLGLSAFIRVHS